MTTATQPATVERELAERLLATLENVLLHYSTQMPEGDRIQRWRLVKEASKAIRAAGGTACDSCDGSGARPTDDNGKGIAPPDGFVIIERCDSCEQFDSDMAAAQSWGISAIWQADDTDHLNQQVICRPRA